MDRAFTSPNRVPSREADEDHKNFALAVEVALDLVARTHVSDQMVLPAPPLAGSLVVVSPGGIDTDGLVQLARLAVVRAVRRNRPGEGHGLTVYAIPTVTGVLKRWFRDRGLWIRRPRRLQEVRARALVEEESLRYALMREADDDAIAAALGCCPLKVAELRPCAGGYHPISLDPATGPGELCVARCPEGDIDACEAFGCAIRALTAEQRLILRLRCTALGFGLAGAAL